MSTQKGGGEVRTECDHQAAVIIVEAVDRGEMADGDGGKWQISGCQISKNKVIRYSRRAHSDYVPSRSVSIW